MADLARLTGARLEPSDNPDALIVGAAPLDRAGPADVAFLGDRKHLAALRATRAGACFIGQAHVGDLPAGCVGLVANRPQAAWAA
ncbi:MAG TPA: LpxD N-terminal domain-containing protein, partial [Caulobacter sp.]|nr:LpxD N-terminal domain-containing protein [Caulobacter sp.]